MDNKGQVVIFTLMLAVVVIILAISFAPVLMEATTNARNDTIVMNNSDNTGTVETIGMNCTGTTDAYVQAGCIVTDAFTPYFVGFLVAIGLAVLGARIAFGS
ncbi:hypothetical protein M0R04_14570 [Candidatus Dojkabacteria bacterium]|jgi:uncharacterized protein (UPF0333 family)|nr:hypothetical protein [Candidatus Dojkabacteria bacterium]